MDCTFLGSVLLEILCRFGELLNLIAVVCGRISFGLIGI